MDLRRATASQEFPLGVFVDSTDGNTAETGLTIANTDIKIWKAGATVLANKNSGGATHIANGIYYAVFDATDTDTIGAGAVFVHVTGALPVIAEFNVLHESVYDAKYGTSAISTLDAAGVRSAVGLASANLDTQLGTIDTTADAILVDTAEIGVAGAGLTNINLPDQTMNIVGNITGNLSGSVGSVTGAVGSVTSGVTVSTNNDKTGYALTATTGLGNQTANITGNLSGSVGSVTGAVGSVAARVTANVDQLNGSAAAAATLAILNGSNVVYQGTVTGAATTTTLVDSGLTQADTDWWKGRIIIFTSVIPLQATDITGFTPGTDTLTFTAVTQAPTGATYVII